MVKLKHDKDIADLHNRCDDIENGYKQEDKNLHDRIDNLEQDIDDQLSNMREEVTTIVGNSGTSIYTTSGTYTAIRTGSHFCILVGGGDGSFGMPYVTLNTLLGTEGISFILYNTKLGYDSLVTFKIVNLIKNVRYDVAVGGADIEYSSDDVERAFGVINSTAYQGDWNGFISAVQTRYNYYYNSNTGSHTTFAGHVGYGGRGGCDTVIVSIKQQLNDGRYGGSTIASGITTRYPITYGYTEEVFQTTERQSRFFVDTYGIREFVNLNHGINSINDYTNKAKSKWNFWYMHHLLGL